MVGGWYGAMAGAVGEDGVELASGLAGPRALGSFVEFAVGQTSGGQVPREGVHGRVTVGVADAFVPVRVVAHGAIVPQWPEVAREVQKTFLAIRSGA